MHGWIGLGGATEATVWSNYFPIGRVDPGWKSIPYGRPIQNARYYVLDAHLSPCAVGVSGNLYIGGECLASGYANDPEKTRERFVRDIFFRIQTPSCIKRETLPVSCPTATSSFWGALIIK